MNIHLKNFLTFIAFISFGVLLLYLVYSNLDKGYQAFCLEEGIPQEECNLAERVANDFLGANFIWVFASVILFMLSNVSRAIQWGLLLEPISHRPKFYNSFLGVMLGYFTNLGLPRVGEFIRSGAMSRYEGIAFEKVLATVVTSRVLDMLLLGVTAIIAIIVEADKILKFAEEYLPGMQSALLLLAIGIIGLLIFYGLLTITSSNAIVLKIQGIAKGFRDGLISITQVKKPFSLIAHTILIWVMYIAMTYVGFWAYEPTANITLSAGIVVFVIASLGFVLPSPGGMGTYHALVIISLSFYGIDKLDAFSYAMIMFIALQIGANVLFGMISLILLPRLNQRKKKIKSSLHMHTEK